MILLRRIFIFLAVLIFGFSVLVASILRTASPKYHFSYPVNTRSNDTFVAGVVYGFPYPGNILPDSFLWPIKAFRDRLSLFLTQDKFKRAKLELFLADMRVMMAEELIQEGKFNVGVSTATKAEKYLERAAEDYQVGQNHDKGAFWDNLARASLKHREILENLSGIVPSDAAPIIMKTIDYPKKVYETSFHNLNALGRISPVAKHDPDLPAK